MAEHKDILSDGAHVIHYWEVADSTALSALTPIIAELNKIALKVDDNTFWQCTEISPATFKLLNEISAEDIKTKYESNADTNALTDALLALLNTNKVKNVTTDAVNDKLVITYTDDTTAELNVTGGSGSEVDLTNYYTKSETYNKVETDSLVDTKQDTLVSGTSIKTVDGSSILGSGDIVTVDSTKLPLTGGTMTGAVTSFRETKIAMGANDINLASGNLFTKTISAATTLTMSNKPASGQVISFILELTNAGSAVITWFSGVKWAGGTAPTLTTAGKDILGCYSHDGGLTWNVLVLGKDVK